MPAAPDRPRRTHTGNSRTYRAAVFVLSLKQPQKRRLALAVTPDEAELPVGIHREGYVLKNIVIASLIAEAEIIYHYLCHTKILRYRGHTDALCTDSSSTHTHGKTKEMK